MKKLLVSLIFFIVLLTGCSLIEDVKDVTVGEISDWVNTHIIDNGINEIKNYINNNDNIDINQTIDKLKNSMTKLEEYNLDIQNIDNQEIKETWDKLYNEMKKQYETIQNNKDNPNNITDFDTSLLEKYQKEFEELIKK